MKKYELLKSDTIITGSHKLYRLRALREIEARDPYRRQTSVHKGDLGGYIESEMNLAQRGESWVFPGAVVYDYARVSGQARVFGLDEAYDKQSATICGFAKIRGRTVVYGATTIADGAIIYGDAVIGQLGDYKHHDSLIVIRGNTRIHGFARIIRGDNPNGLITIDGDIELGGNVELIDTSLIGDVSLKTSIVRTGIAYTRQP